LQQLARQLAKSGLIRDDSVVSITNLVARWVAIKNGSPQALAVIGQETLQPGSTYPNTRAAIKQNLDEIYASPFETYASLFINRDYTISVVLIDLQGGTTFDEASTAWDEVWSIVGGLEALRPAALNVNMGGYTAFSYLFITYEMPWVEAMSYVTQFLVAALVFVLTRDWKATLLVFLLDALATIWWFGMLPFVDIGLSVTLTIPLIFIYCIGSDYGLHLALDLRRGEGFRHTFQTVGKAVLFSAATDVGAFALFIPMENLMMRKSMIATSLAILVIFTLTMLLVPLFYRRDAQGTRHVQVIAARPAAVGGPVRNVQRADASTDARG
jgi:predicted RND superfamily exporter protein